MQTGKQKYIDYTTIAFGGDKHRKQFAIAYMSDIIMMVMVWSYFNPHRSILFFDLQ